MSALKICPQCGTEYELDQRFCPKDGTTLKTQGGESDLVGSIIADRYHVLRKLGEGGMGQVYLAEHVKMGRKSAVKVMNPGMVHDADAISRFNREASNASRISHPNVAAVYDFGETGDGLIYLAMEFIEGPSLTKVIEQMGALPPQRAAEITRQAGEALTIAHDMGIVHRDLKPDNIMLAKNRDNTDLVKVVDFGIAKAADNDAQKVTKTGLVVGTPEYMSPEQLAGDRLDGRSDIYSLGLVAFNMFTGKLPFPGESAQEAMIMRLTDKPKTLSEMRPEVAWTPEIQAVMDKALARDASLRYQSAAEFGRDLARAVGKMPASAATSAGTQMIGASAAPAGPTEAIPATRVARESARSATATPPPRPAITPAGKSKTPLIAAAAVVVALGGGTAFWFMTHTPDAGVKAPTSQAADSTKSHSAIGDTNASRGRSPSDTGTKPEQFKKSVSSPPGPDRGTKTDPRPLSEGGSGKPIDVDSELKRLDDLSTDSAKGKSGAVDVIRSLDGLSSHLTTPTRRVHAALVRAQAEVMRDNLESACAILRQVEQEAVQTIHNRRVRSVLDHCGGPP